MRTDDNNSDNHNVNDDGDDHIGDDEGVDNKVDDDHNNDNHRNEHNGNCNTDNIKIQEFQNSITRSIFDIPLLDCVCVFFALINFFLSFCFMNF